MPSFPLRNRIVAFVGPYLAIISGMIATWLVVHVQVLGSLGVGHDAIASAISNVGVFLVSTAVVWLGHQKWLTGWIAHEARIPVVVKPPQA